MPLSPEFPISPYAVLDPDIRWYPGDQQELFTEDGYARLLPPLVYTIRKAVKAWRDSGYAGASDTTRALLNHWFKTEHQLPQADGTMVPFRYYFAQREAVESAIWLYEVEKARDPYALIKFDASGRVSKGMFSEDWTRYVMKMATGAGKTKVMSLLVAWAYFHRRYEAGSDLSTNFLIIAPNIIVLDRLREDFDGLKVFFKDPVLPENGHEGQNWRDDFQPTLHVQDEIGVVSDTGNIFLTNIHRVYENESAPSINDDNTMDYFLGQRPTGKTNESQVDLGQIVREVPDLVLINDEAHHIHDERMAWFKNIQDISNQLRLKGSKLSVQLDLTATPKHEDGAIFVQTISDYPLVEAIRQQVVKTPVLPDAPSRAKLMERASSKFTERYQDYLHLGYLEWEKRYKELEASGKKSVLFVMTEDTRNCDEVGDYLEARYPELRGKVLVIHTKNNGEISESSSGKSKEELEKLRKESREIDLPENRVKAIVSVMMLREGWDVKNVVAMVGLRPFVSDSKILPEQALGRGLRLMFRGWSGEGGLPIDERVSVVGTSRFMEFVESIRSEGVELEYSPMGEGTKPKSPVVVEVDRDNKKKDIDKLDVELPVLAPRIQREYKNLAHLDVGLLPKPALPVKDFSEEEQREIVFKDIDTEGISHTTVLDSVRSPSHQSAVGFFAQSIMRDLRLVGGFDVLFGKLKEFMETALFKNPVDLDDLNVLRNLSEPEVTRAVLETFKSAVNALTVQDKGTTEIRDTIKLSRIRPFVVNDQAYVVPGNSVFNKIVGDNDFELEVAGFLASSKQIISFAKNPTRKPGAFKIEYRTEDGSIADYYPDFIVKETEANICLIETKGREDLEDPHKWERLKQWCADATAKDGTRTFHPLFVRQEQWEKYQPKTFKAMCETFREGGSV
jgi:type III restriction enzyme